MASVSTSQEVSAIPEAMVLEEKTPDLLALLTAHVGANAPTVPLVVRPLVTPLKRRERGGKGLEGADKGEIVHSA